MCDIRSRWTYVPGANWRHPEGPSSTIDGKERNPVVQVVFDDAAAYAAWAGKEISSRL
jgi:formylglycine-generating enzyme required for sulfatase activity